MSEYILPRSRSEDLPSELTQHAPPPNQTPELCAWLRLQALRHAHLAEQRPLRRRYHEQLASDASSAAAFYERQRKEAA